MIKVWFGLSMEWQVFIVWVVGLSISPIINWAIYNLAYCPRPISPWRRRRYQPYIDQEPALVKLIANTAALSWKHLPIVGWLFMREESEIHGRYFWLRPCCIEVIWPCFLGWLFWYEVTGGLLPELALPPLAAIQPSLHVQFLSHAILCFFMCVAMFIDFDERMIPDSITIPGTLVGLIGAACFSNWHLWISATDPLTGAWPSTLNYDSPWNGSLPTNWQGFWIGMGCLAIWCFSLADRRLILRRGWRKAIAYFFAGLVRIPTWKFLLGLWIVTSIGFACAWPTFDVAGQRSILSSLIGMVLGGFTVWIVRWIAGLAIGIEALGFGDVTLMAMVGAYVGWQPTSIAFFISPMIALLFVFVRYLITGDSYTPFGPYLCAGVLVTILLWDGIWNNYFQSMLIVMGPILGQLLLVALLLMGGLLRVWRMIKKSLSLPKRHESATD